MSEPVTIDVQLREMYDAVDPVPQYVLDAALGAYAWRTVDADLAELAADSALLSSSVRGQDAARLMTFEGRVLTVEIEVADTGDTRRIVGQLIPPGPAEIRVETPSGSSAVAADSLGRFTAADVPAGLMRLSIATTGGTSAGSAVTTKWTTI